MDETSDNPPSSTVLVESFGFTQVIFNNVNKFYDLRGDITCHYTLAQNMVPRKKDWVGIFRVGWKTTRDFYTFMWAPLPSDNHSDTSVQQQIQFKSYYLPKDDEYYQFCYVDQSGMVRGASVPFQFREETMDDILVVRTQGEVEEIELQNKKLSEENQELKANCARLHQQINYLQEDLKKTQGLQNNLEGLKSHTEKLELQVNSLKAEKKRLEELDESRRAELCQLREQIQNTTLEKHQLDSRLRSTRERVDLLQGEVEAVGQQNKKLREENEACTANCARLQKLTIDLQEDLKKTQQQKQDLKRECEKQMHSAEILQARKEEADEENQKLRDENDKLLKVLPQTRWLSSFSSVSQFPAQVGGLVYGNPYCAAEAGLGAEAACASLRECSLGDDVFPEDGSPSHYRAHVQCPFCSKTFKKSKRPVIVGHILCHDLE